MKLSLVVLTPGPAQGKVLSINEMPFFIGRDGGCHLRPTSIHISKRHCALVRREDKAFVLDFDSINGTFVNDRQVKGGMELLNGDQLRVGPLVFAVHLETVPVDVPTPIPARKVTIQKRASGQAARLPAKQSARAGIDEDEAASTLMSKKDGGAPDAGPRPEIFEGSGAHELSLPVVTDAQSILDKYLKRPRTS
ncbi:MAG TPA: FHA domain-containing protein [Gemmataceae bacterium]|jgi:predicted component of type VI protein secretion system